ncbi:MAG: hypothetical protein KDI36_02875 [Pseudomonadales bacterium]|nr:hypothetical protein [Pseudomonadales bacterium]
MDIYHIWCDLKPGCSDTEFVRATQTWLDQLRSGQLLSDYRITRRKLGLGGKAPGEFHLMLEFTGLAQLDEAFSKVASRTDPLESFHHAVNSKVENISFALYRDFPDAVRQEGEEKF